MIQLKEGMCLDPWIFGCVLNNGNMMPCASLSNQFSFGIITNGNKSLKELGIFL